MPQPGTPIRLDDDTRRNLGGAIVDLIRGCEEDHATFLTDLKHWWDWYHAKPLTQVRTEPWPRAANVVVPMIRTACDAIAARLHGSLHTERATWSITSRNESLRSYVKPLEQFLNHEAHHTFDLRKATRDWVQECTVIGRSVLALNWVERQGYRFKPGTSKPQAVMLSRGPLVEHVPAESILWQKDREIAQSDYVIRQNQLTWNEIALACQTSGWDRAACDRIHMSPGLTGPGREVVESKRETHGVSTNYRDFYDIREVWVSWPLAQLLSRSSSEVTSLELADSDDPAVPIVVTLHVPSGEILRCVAHPYYFDGWPFFDLYFRKIAGQAYSAGVAKILEHIQRAVTTMANQSIDGVTLANSVKVLTQSSRMKDLQFIPNRPIYVENLADVQPLSMPNPLMPDIALINMLTAMAERVTGIADPMLGRETRLGGHPSPATNTLVQLQESSKLFAMTQREARAQLSILGEYLLLLYQQADIDRLDDQLRLTIGDEDAARVAETLISPENFHFDVVALSEGVNAEVERTAAITKDQLLTNYYGFALRMLPALYSPQTPPQLRAHIATAIEAKGKLMIDTLESLGEDEPETLVLRLQEATRAATQQLADFQQGALGGAPGGPQEPVQQPPLGPLPGGANGAAPPPGDQLVEGPELG